MRLSRAVILVAITALAGCSNSGKLRDLRSFTGGPDEFLVAPSKELTLPGDYSQLPAPTPGGVNRTDQDPKADAVAALGGKRSALVATGVPATDGALVNHVARNGVSPTIRADLAEEDAAFRKRQARFTNIRLVRVDRYNQAYRRFRLDARKEAARWRAVGIPTPSAPYSR
ncbi:DUF3035 domain-containing protein [Thalassovita sp.]|jgi:hypothetical protein|uniref:DUF3035 domain-containing protein n=1 Tax=Thalassovita sp. TaxID=1979401 RepID=UPI003B5C5F8E